MKRISHHALGILQGTRMMFTDFSNDGPMWAGSGPREVRHHITFSEVFRQVPAVMVGISMWDADRRSNLRGDLMAENISESGFDLVFRTWSDTRLARVRADWTAMGALADEEDWDID